MTSSARMNCKYLKLLQKQNLKVNRNHPAWGPIFNNSCAIIDAQLFQHTAWWKHYIFNYVPRALRYSHGITKSVSWNKTFSRWSVSWVCHAIFFSGQALRCVAPLKRIYDFLRLRYFNLLLIFRQRWTQIWHCSSNNVRDTSACALVSRFERQAHH